MQAIAAIRCMKASMCMKASKRTAHAQAVEVAPVLARLDQLLDLRLWQPVPIQELAVL